MLIAILEGEQVNTFLSMDQQEHWRHVSQRDRAERRGAVGEADGQRDAAFALDVDRLAQQRQQARLQGVLPRRLDQRARFSHRLDAPGYFL